MPRCQRSVVNISRKPIEYLPGSLLCFFPSEVRLAVMLDGNAQALEVLTVLPLLQIHLAKMYALRHSELLACRLNGLIPSAAQFTLEAISKFQKAWDVLAQDKNVVNE